LSNKEEEVPPIEEGVATPNPGGQSKPELPKREDENISKED